MIENKLPQESGVYKIVNKINGKVYVGSTNNILVRYHHHMRELRNKKHGNRYLQRAFNKYGEDAFLFRVIELCDVSEIRKREDFWIVELRAHRNDGGYNLIDKARNLHPLKGVKKTPEHIAKLVASRKANKSACGEKSPHAKLTALQVNEIRTLYKHGVSATKLEKIYQMSSGAIGGIIYEKTWLSLPFEEVDVSHIAIPDDVIPNTTRGMDAKHAVLTDADVLEIRRLVNDGVKQRDLAQKFGVAESVITVVKSGDGWAHVGGPISAKRKLRKTTDEERNLIVKMRNDGAKYSDIGAIIGMKCSAVRQIYLAIIK